MFWSFIFDRFILFRHNKILASNKNKMVNVQHLNPKSISVKVINISSHSQPATSCVKKADLILNNGLWVVFTSYPDWDSTESIQSNISQNFNEDAN